jgi:glycosyltransferase involved in cell wall biosynthesis
VVVSPTVYGRVVEHGRSGLVCQTADEWEEALSSLVEDEERRRAMADALAADVLAKWSMKKNYWRWPAAWRRLREGA